ncbi:hypothetical protein AMELA_G00134320 [Ameiurus melas]|uniref:Uncharacterized protein n=1 Tax=Ameiurus melas TaxID=219545 RepID=A0A7J6ALI3_AMEME|nr:hypothetical protein AMELA_G00134320 [Ameiurus melas]
MFSQCFNTLHENIIKISLTFYFTLNCVTLFLFSPVIPPSCRFYWGSISVLTACLSTCLLGSKRIRLFHVPVKKQNKTKNI